MSLAVLFAGYVSSLVWDQQTPECFDLWGRPLYRPTITGLANQSVTRNLETAERMYKDDFSNQKIGEHDPDKAVWVGRRVAYQWRYNDAINNYTNALANHTNYAPLRRHRGHRYISVRGFSKAEEDLTKASDLIKNTPDYYEQDGSPNQFNVPTSTFHSNVYYHLGLSRLFNNNNKGSLEAFSDAMTVAYANSDQLVATANWYYILLRRNGEDEKASQLLLSLSDNLQVIENGDYYSLLKMYKNLPGYTPEILLKNATSSPLSFSTIGYGVGNYYFQSGEKEKATQIMSQIVSNTSSYWAAFGYIAAEVQLHQWGWKPREM